MHDKYIKECLKQAEKAYKRQEVPIGAIIVRNGVILSKAFNKKNSSNNPLHHAEIIAIIKACKRIHDWRLENAEMYVTLEPCEMCKKIIETVRIETVYYGCKSLYNSKEKCKYYLMENKDCKKIIIDFFKEKRNER